MNKLQGLFASRDAGAAAKVQHGAPPPGRTRSMASQRERPQGALLPLATSLSSSSLRDRLGLQKSGRVGPIASAREITRLGPHGRLNPTDGDDSTRTGSGSLRDLRQLVPSPAKTLLAHRLPTMKRLLKGHSAENGGSASSGLGHGGGGGGGGDGPGPGPGRKLRPEKSNRRIRRREFHVVPAAPTAEKMQKLRWVILPRSTWKVRWDLWIGAIIAYSVVMIPYRIGFAIDLARWEEVVNYVFDASFGVDIVLNLFTGYYDEDVFVYDLNKIRLRYLRSWFVFDVLSTLPLDKFFQVVTAAPVTSSSSLAVAAAAAAAANSNTGANGGGSDPSLLSLKLLRTIRLFRLLKLMRLMRLKRAVETIQMDALNAHVLQTARSLLMIIFIIHLVSCAWYMFYTWDPEGLNWVTYWAKQTNRTALPVDDPYLVSFYWVANTMMSVGYGDICGITDAERVFSMFVECLGSICVGLIIANIQMLTENYNPRGVKMKQKIQETKEFLLQRSIPRRLRQRVLSQFEYHWSRRTVFDEHAILRQFPISLQYEILAASMESFVKKFPVFGMASVEFFVYTVPRLRPIVVGPGQTVVEAESVWEELYFIVTGSMEALRGNTVASTLDAGDVCGIEYVVGGRRRYHHSYQTTAKTELYAIYSADLLEAMQTCPIAAKYLTDLAFIIAERYADAARLGKKAQQKDGTHRRASLELFLQYRHRKSSSYQNLVKPEVVEPRRVDLAVSDDIIRLHWSLIRHYSRRRILWDTIMGVLVAWTAISVPFRISFDVHDNELLSTSDRVSDLIFMADVCLNFFTTYVDETGVEVFDRHEIRRHYLKTSFLVDVVSSIPFDFVVERVTASSNFRSLKLIRTVKLVKLLRLVRVAKIFKLNAQWISELDVSMDKIRLLRLLAPVLTIAHYVGCFWYYMSSEEPAENAWWGRVHFDNPDSVYSRYVASVYWATTTMATVGFGDIYAINSREQLYSIIVMIGGTTLFAYVVGTVIEVVSNSKSLMNREHEMGQRINAYVKERGVSSEFIVACQEHLRYLNMEKTLFDERGLFDALSHCLRGELVLHLNSNVLTQIRFFDKKPKWFLTLLLPRLVPQFFSAGDLLIYHGNLVSGIFFLMSGTVIARVPRQQSPLSPGGGGGSDTSRSTGFAKTVVTVSTNGNTTEAVPDRDGTIATLYEGEFFGYKEVLTGSVAQYNVFACRPTGVYLLPSADLDAIHDYYPDVLDEMRNLFLHSITKQQTILQHWHNNEIMGISGDERQNIMRRGRRRRSARGDVPILTHEMTEVVESTASEEADAGEEEPPSRRYSGSIQHLESLSSEACDDANHSMPVFTSSTRRSSRLVVMEHVDTADTGHDGSSLDVPPPTLPSQTHVPLPSTRSIDDENEHRIPSLSRRSPNPDAPRANSVVVRAAKPFLEHRYRRSSIDAGHHRGGLVTPQLQRYPSLPHEISAIVERLLEVEGYRKLVQSEETADATSPPQSS